MKYLKKFNEIITHEIPSDIIEFLKQKATYFEDEFDIKMYVTPTAASDKYSIASRNGYKLSIVIYDNLGIITTGNNLRIPFIMTNEIKDQLQSIIDYMSQEGYPVCDIDIDKGRQPTVLKRHISFLKSIKGIFLKTDPWIVGDSIIDIRIYF